jgi:hypothetical protein
MALLDLDLLHHHALGGQRQRDAETGEAGGEDRTEDLGLRVHDDEDAEGRSEQPARDEEHGDGELCARVAGQLAAARIDVVAFRRLGWRRPAGQQAAHDAGAERQSLEHPHRARSPKARTTPRSTTPARSHAIRPSGIGPMFPIAHPPRLSGLRCART